jgi:transcriptional regulator with XRE-family HTH domain
MPEFATRLPYSTCMRVARSRLQHRIAGVIRRHREAQRWTQEAFADHIEMHRAQYGLVERGGSKDIQLSTLERIAAGLGEHVWTLVREAEEP